MEHPNFLSIRKLFIIMIGGPFALLTLLAVIDPYWQKPLTAKTAGIQCDQIAANSTSQLHNSNCQTK